VPPRILARALAVAAAVSIAGCGQPDTATRPAAQQLPGQPAPAAVDAPAATTPTTSAPARTPSSTRKIPKPKTAAPPTRRAPPNQHANAVVVLDPGHNGGNSSNPGVIDEEVPAGHGQTKACNTAGTATNDGYPEHAFTFDVAVRVQRILAAHHVVGLLTRSNDHGVGPCVNQRAAFGNAQRATAVVAIHADGHQGGHGFHVIESADAPAGAAVAGASHRLAVAVHDDFLAESGFGLSTYLGVNGYTRRLDLAGLELSLRPTIFIECGNMRDSADAARMRTPAGRQRAAQAIADGILSYLVR
jgi:N-acetylmuramoyl-L-alanine amidase